MTEIFILAGARTPFTAWSRGHTGAGGLGGALKALDPFDLGAAALSGSLKRCRVRPGDLDQVVFANMYQVGPHACYGGRYAGLRAGIPDSVPAVAVNMACGSGLFGLLSAASAVREGASLVAAVGADSSSNIPKEIFIPSFTDLACGKTIGETVDALGRGLGIARRDVDAWAMRSHRLALTAQKEGYFAEEIVETAGRTEDDALTPNPDPASFEAARPVTAGGELVTRLNTHAVVDGGSALILASKAGAAKVGGAPLGRWVTGACAATAPDRMGVASVPALRAALERAFLSTAEIDLFEINETFAAQVLSDMRELNLPEERVNVNGGAIALGHPFAATGGRQILSLLLEMRRRGSRRGAAAISIGGGQGIAAIVEAI